MQQPMSPPPPPALAPPAPYPPPRRSIPALVPQLIWEGVLLLVVLVACTAALLTTSLFEGDGIWWVLASNGMLASAVALSLRTATPNLAVVGLAGLSGAIYTELIVQAEVPWVLAAALAMLAVLVVGGLFGLIAGLTSAPAWAVSLAGLAVLQGAVFGVVDLQVVQVDRDLPQDGAVWFVLFALISLAGGGLFAIPQVRRLLSANRTDGDRVRFTGSRLLGAVVGFTGSSALAGLAGIVIVNQLRAFEPTGFYNISNWLLTAVAVALLGGVSVFGGRGGIAGTLLAATLMVVTLTWLTYEDLFQPWGRWLVIGFVALVGIGVSRAIEAIAPAQPDAVVPPAPPPPEPADSEEP